MSQELNFDCSFVNYFFILCVIQGMLNTISEVINSTEKVLGLWKHEVTRVIADRFTNHEDGVWFDSMCKKVGTWLGWLGHIWTPCAIFLYVFKYV